ncbi:MAG TPA: hypothetical protein VFW21_01780 [Mycobacterium sp.]|nr:hypothetical protein [Mycobacterium sp.]
MTEHLRPAPGPLREWTGLTRCFTAQNGTTALAVALRALVDGLAVNLAAIGCWTVTSAVRQAALTPHYLDVGDDLLPAVVPNGPAVVVAPWGAALRPLRPVSPTSSSATVLDGSVSLFGDGAAALAPDALIVSLGPGKPGHVPGGGGLLLFDDDSVEREVVTALRHGTGDLRWLRDGLRVVPSTADPRRVDERLAALAAGLDTHRHRAAEALDRVVGATPHLVPSGAPDPDGGASTLLPVLLAPHVPLDARDVARVALAHRLPLGFQPVTPPYMEEAGRGLTGDCPVAEGLAGRLLFVPAEPAVLARYSSALHTLLEELVAAPDDFRYPYTPSVSVDGAKVTDAPLPAVLTGPSVLLGRRLDRRFVAVDELAARQWLVSDPVAASILQGAALR